MLRDRLNALGFLQHAHGLRHHLLADGSDRQFILVSLEQRDGEFVIELLARYAERRLADETRRGSTPAVTFARHGNSVTQFGECHGVMLASLVMQAVCLISCLKLNNAQLHDTLAPLGV